jgi:hypothetical protein
MLSASPQPLKIRKANGSLKKTVTTISTKKLATSLNMIMSGKKPKPNRAM